ncbi:aspartic peptidase domain-containing protein [Mycena galericulata]|nr:aspartic peptidase domain-containing protein [Mycena galericulata]
MSLSSPASLDKVTPTTGFSIQSRWGHTTRIPQRVCLSLGWLSILARWSSSLDLPDSPWIFAQHPTLITDMSNATERRLDRTGRQGYYTLGATQNPGEKLTVSYLDGSIVDVDLYTGPLYLRAGLKPDASAFHVCRSPNFIFGVATRATSHFRGRKMDGILGLGFRKTGKLQSFVTSLHHEELIEGKKISNTGLRLVALILYCRRKSYLTIGDNTGTAVQLNGVWSPWIPVVESSTHWVIRLESLVIGEETHDIQWNAIIDSGTTFSYLPDVACQRLHAALGGAQTEWGSSRVLYRRNQPSNKTVNFKFSGVQIIRCLADLLDPRINTFEDAQGEAAAYSAFKPMGTVTFNVPEESRGHCILGNFFLRGFIVEFERTNYGSGGRVRFASRGNDV